MVQLIRKNERDNLLSDNLLTEVNREADRYHELVGKGEYIVKYLLLITKLLMFQEKTNLNNAYIFKNLLEALKDGANILNYFDGYSKWEMIKTYFKLNEKTNFIWISFT